MELDLAQQRQQAHSLLDGLPDEKLVTVRNLLELLAEPLPRSLATSRREPRSGRSGEP